MCKLPSSLPPARVEPRSRTAQLGPFPLIAADAADAADEFREAISCAQAAEIRPTCSENDVQFSIKSRRRPKGAQGAPKGSHKCPKTPQGWPKGSQRTAKGAQGHPKGSQKDPKVGPREAKGSPKTPKGSQRDKDIYLETPDQPPKRPLC